MRIILWANKDGTVKTDACPAKCRFCWINRRDRARGRYPRDPVKQRLWELRYGARPNHNSEKSIDRYAAEAYQIRSEEFERQLAELKTKVPNHGALAVPTRQFESTPKRPAPTPPTDTPTPAKKKKNALPETVWPFQLFGGFLPVATNAPLPQEIRDFCMNMAALYAGHRTTPAVPAEEKNQADNDDDIIIIESTDSSVVEPTREQAPTETTIPAAAPTTTPTPMVVSTITTAPPAPPALVTPTAPPALSLVSPTAPPNTPLSTAMSNPNDPMFSTAPTAFSVATLSAATANPTATSLTSVAMATPPAATALATVAMTNPPSATPITATPATPLAATPHSPAPAAPIPAALPPTVTAASAPVPISEVAPAESLGQPAGSCKPIETAASRQPNICAENRINEQLNPIDANELESYFEKFQKAGNFPKSGHFSVLESLLRREDTPFPTPPPIQLVDFPLGRYPYGEVGRLPKYLDPDQEYRTESVIQQPTMVPDDPAFSAQFSDIIRDAILGGPSTSNYNYTRPDESRLHTPTVMLGFSL